MAIIIPYMATASQNIMLTRFLVLILGALTPPPKILAPVAKIPLQEEQNNIIPIAVVV